MYVCARAILKATLVISAARCGWHLQVETKAICCHRRCTPVGGIECFIMFAWSQGDLPSSSICFADLSSWLSTYSNPMGECQRDQAFFGLAAQEFRYKMALCRFHIYYIWNCNWTSTTNFFHIRFFRKQHPTLYS